MAEAVIDTAVRRLERLRRTGLLDVPPEPAFERATRLAVKLLNAPVSLVSLVDRDRQFFQSAVGLDEPWASRRESPLSHSVCRRVVAQGRPVMVADACLDPALRGGPAVTEFGVAAYLGVPLTMADGNILGALCVIDHVPRNWTDDDVAILDDLARGAMSEFDLRVRVAECERVAAEHRRDGERLRESERKLRAVFDATFQFIGLLDPDGKVLQANRSSLQFADTTADAVVGLPFPDTPWWRGSGASKARLRHAIAEAAQGRFVRFETEHPRANGDAITVDFSLSPVRDDEGRVVMLIAEGRDITEGKRTADALRDADRRKDEFVAVLAHELRNPLAAIAHAVRVLELRDGEPQLRAQMRDLIENQNRMLTRLVDDLLDVARIARGKVRLRPEPIDLAASVQRAIVTTRPLLHLRNHRLDLHLPDRPVTLRADPLRLEQIFVNLLTNAAKYTDPGGTLTVSAEAVSEAVGGTEWARVSIRDDGLGIAAELLPRVFDPFTQDGRTLDHSRGGLGVGLTLVRALVALHGGTVEAHSAGPGRGSEFTVRIPLSGPGNPAPEPIPVMEPPLSMAPASPAAPTRPEAKPVCRRVLLIDDNVSATEALALILEYWGHAVRICHDGPSGLLAADEFLPDVVLLDIGLPGLDGHAVARVLREHSTHRGVVLIAVTGFGRDDDRRRSEAAGFDDHLVKPLDLGALETLLSKPTLAPTGRGSV